MRLDRWQTRPGSRETRTYWRGFRRPSVPVSSLSCCPGAGCPMSSWSGYQITRPPTEGVMAVTAVTLILSMTPLFEVAMLATGCPFGTFAAPLDSSILPIFL
jgi:hypothetical protein